MKTSKSKTRDKAAAAPAAAAEAPGDEKPVNPTVSALAMGGRVVLAAGLLWITYLYTFPSSNEPAPPDNAIRDAERQARTQLPELEAPPALFLGDMMDGSWRFAGAPWSTEWRTPQMTDDELAQRPEPRRDLDAEPTDMDGRIVELAKAVTRTPEDASPMVRYRGQLAAFKFSLYTSRRDGKEWVQEARINMEQKGVKGTLVLKPTDRTAEADDLSEALAFAPPLPDTVSVLATRRTDEGEAMGVIAQTESTIQQLSELWIAAGWRVESSQAVPQAEGEALICEKGGRAWSAWRMPAAAGRDSTLMLIRVPDRIPPPQ